MKEPIWQNRTLLHGDNLDLLRALNSESVDLIALAAKRQDGVPHVRRRAGEGMVGLRGALPLERGECEDSYSRPLGGFRR